MKEAPHPGNEYHPQEPGVLIFLIAAVLGDGLAAVLATHVLGLSSLWISLPTGAFCALAGLVMGENIGDAIVSTVALSTLVFLVLTVIPEIPLLRKAILPVVAGFCIGKLTHGVWKELSLRANERSKRCSQ